MRGLTHDRETGTPRRVLLLAHTGRDAAREVTLAFCKALTGHGLLVRMLEEEAADLELDSASYDPPLELVGPDADAGADCEIAVVVGGDGSILRAAEVTWASGTPVLGVNLGHVGFLAEAEPDDVEATIEAIVQRTWTPEDRLTLDVRAYRDGELVTHTFALNEASVEKAARERMLEVVVEIDSRPLSRWGCDGVVLLDPDGLDRLQLQRGRAGGLAGRRGAAWSCRSARTRCSPGRWWSRPTRCSRSRSSPAPTAPACSGATAGDRSTCRRAPGSRYAAGSGRSAWPGCTGRRSPTGWSPSSTSRWTAGGAPPSAGAAPEDGAGDGRA